MTTARELYGTDWLCGAELDPTGREIEGVDVVAQPLLHRLETRQGTLVDDDPDYGDDLTELVSEGLDAADLLQIGRRVESQFERDERVSTARAQVTARNTPDGYALEVDAQVELVSGGTLSFTGLIDQTKTQLIRAEETT